ncbi:APC family permease [Paraburkholderia dipogonis]|uniref:APC family permease n=2 Tax=Paraburkholderia dipogonis TaxID=1211383 RepID=A0A4Y8MJ29_9BURK|nr:APC family permease [Paraburkholderia dipogonis]
MAVKEISMKMNDVVLGHGAPNEAPKKLSGNMGPVGLALTVLAFSAPLTVLSGYIPISVMFGGIGTPLAFAIATVMLLLFSVGYVTLNNVVKRPGDFYAFISYGIGKSTGLGSGILAALSYFLLLAGVTSFFGVACSDLQREITGSAFPWYMYTLLDWAAVGVLGYLHVELSAKVLTTAMVVEVAICLLFSFGVTLKGGVHQVDAMTPFVPHELTRNNAAFATLFAVSFFLGFEATALFRDEVRMPDRTIPVATYGSVIFIGILYTFGSYAMVLAYGTSAQEVATKAPATMFIDAFSKFVNGRVHLVVSVLVLSSAFASALSTQNVLSRYLHNLGTDGALPRYLSKVHGKHASPYLASVTVSLLVLCVLVPFIVMGAKPDLLYGQLTGLAAAGVMLLMTIVNVSALLWFFRAGRELGVSFLKACVAPSISSVFFIGLLYLVARHFELLAGGEPGQYVWMLYCLLAVQAGGMLLAQYFRYAKPAVFQRLGRSHH